MAQKEGVALATAVGGSNDEIIALDGDNNIRCYVDHPLYQDLVVALNGKKFSKLAEKKVILKMFRSSELDDAEKYCWDFWSGHGIHIFESIRINTTIGSQINKLNTDFVAGRLCELYVLDDWIKELPPPEHGRRLCVREDPTIKTKKVFSSLQTFVDGTILKNYREDRLKVKKASRSKANL